MTKYLEFKWTISRAQDTYGYNIVTLLDTNTNKKYRTMGGGYDMQGAVFGEWLQDNYQKELRANHVEIGDMSGVYVDDDGVNLNGCCGLETMVGVAEVIGLSVEKVVAAKGHLKGLLVVQIAPLQRQELRRAGMLSMGT